MDETTKERASTYKKIMHTKDMLVENDDFYPGLGRSILEAAAVIRETFL